MSTDALRGGLYRLALRASYWSGLTQSVRSARRGGRHCLILTYHGITCVSTDAFDPLGRMCVTPEAFDRQLRYLRRHFRVMSLGDALAFLRHPAGGGPVAVVTFDDGYRTVLTEARPILQQHGIPCTLFLATAFIGGTRIPWWNTAQGLIARPRGTLRLQLPGLTESYRLSDPRERWRLFAVVRRMILSQPGSEEILLSSLAEAVGMEPDADPRGAFLSWDEVRVLTADAAIEIGVHTVSHPVASRLSAAAWWEEITASRRVIEAELGRLVLDFAYPYGQSGDFTEETGAALRRAGYRCGLTSVEGLNRPGDDPFVLRRIGVLRLDRFSDFASRAWGIGEVLRHVGGG